MSWQLPDISYCIGCHLVIAFWELKKNGANRKVQECTRVCVYPRRKENWTTHLGYECFKILQMPTGHPLAYFFSNHSIFQATLFTNETFKKHQF